jgi:hypothetical protein
MKARTLKKDKVNIITLGCSKNMVDSEVLSGQLAANDINVVHENAKLDHNIVRGKYLRLYRQGQRRIHQYHPGPGRTEAQG